jgi:hypothetical protein
VTRCGNATKVRFDTVLLTSAALAAFPAIARADAPNPDAAPKPERRSGLLVGVTPLLSSGTAFGYPNQAAQIGDPKYFANGGAMAGGGVNAYVMAALADVFNFGVYFGYTRIANGDWHSEGIGGGFRLEAFPLYSLVPRLKDLGLFAQFGIGSANLEPTRGYYPGSDGVQSYVSAGVFYEFTVAHFKHGHLTLAPSLEYDYVGARSIDRHTAGLGLRVAFYSGP